MNIYAEYGHCVVYLDENGYDIEREYARKAGLVRGEIYQVAYTDVYSSSTDVCIIGYTGLFNSVMFDDYEEKL